MHRILPSFQASSRDVFVALAAVLALAAAGCGADAGSSVSIRKTIDDAWAEHARKVAAGDDKAVRDFERRTGRSLFDYYLLTPDDEPERDELAAAAIRMWGNLGDDDSIDASLEQIDRHSAIWVAILPAIADGYASARRPESDTFHLFIELDEWLTHPASRSELLLRMSDFHVDTGNHVEAEKLRRHVVELDAGRQFVERANQAARE